MLLDPGSQGLSAVAYNITFTEFAQIMRCVSKLMFRRTHDLLNDVVAWYV